MIHAYCKYTPKDSDTVRRNTLAEKSWTGQFWKERPITDDEIPCMWVEGDRRFPFVKSFFQKAVEGLADDEILVYTNSDIICRSDCSLMIAATLQDTNAAYCYRRDFHNQLNAIPADANFRLAVPYSGSDLYAFRVGWWKVYQNEFPDLIFGFEAWDACLRRLIDLTNPPHQRLKDLIVHEKHNSHWERKENRYALPGQLHCLREAFKWMVKRGINPAEHGLRLPD